MKRLKALAVPVCLLMAAMVPAYAQQGTFGIYAGQTRDAFGSLPSVSGAEVGIEGQVAVVKSNPKKGTPNIVVGGEIRLPTDTQNHAKEFAFFGGPEFVWHNLTIGVHAQLRKMYLPPSRVDNQFFVRDRMVVLEIPLVVRYNFGPAKRAFIGAEGAPEFTPHFTSGGSLTPLPNPNLDHGYFVRGNVGYNFGKWYVKATYENRYFKFIVNQGNPTNLYSWKSNLVSLGAGFVF